MFDKINISSVNDFKRHYKNKHDYIIERDDIKLINNHITFPQNNKLFLGKFCDLCGKEFIVNEQKMKLEKILDHFKNIIVFDDNYADVDLIKHIFYLSRRKHNKSQHFITTKEIQKMVRMGLTVLLKRDNK